MCCCFFFVPCPLFLLEACRILAMWSSRRALGDGSREKAMTVHGGWLGRLVGTVDGQNSANLLSLLWF